MVGKTIAEKILSKKSGKDARAGQIVIADVDYVMVNDVTGPIAFREYDKLGTDELYKDKMVLIPDHYVPAKDIDSAAQAKEMREFSQKHQIPNYFEIGKSGVCHQLMVEEGFAAPGRLIVGADSHTCTYGAVNALSTGIGSTEAAAVFATGKLWFKVPTAIRVNLIGKKQKWVSGKDVILHLIGEIGVDGARYQSIEFTGPGVAELSMDDRFTICNMAIEAGGKNGIFPVDEKTIEYMKAHSKKPYTVYEADADAEYTQEVTIDLSTLKSTISFPHLPENTHELGSFEDIKIDQSVIGSCTNGRIQDMREAAEILRGRKVAPDVRCIVIPGTQDIYMQMLKEGLVMDFIEAGAVVSTPTCGPCLGGYMGILAPHERCVSTTNRNFVGRMGDTTSEIYLASPAVAAASAVTGKISGPEELGL